MFWELYHFELSFELICCQIISTLFIGVCMKPFEGAYLQERSRILLLKSIQYVNYITLMSYVHVQTLDSTFKRKRICIAVL